MIYLSALDSGYSLEWIPQWFSAQLEKKCTFSWEANQNLPPVFQNFAGTRFLSSLFFPGMDFQNHFEMIKDQPLSISWNLKLDSEEIYQQGEDRSEGDKIWQGNTDNTIELVTISTYKSLALPLLSFYKPSLRMWIRSQIMSKGLCTINDVQTCYFMCNLLFHLLGVIFSYFHQF